MVHCRHRLAIRRSPPLHMSLGYFHRQTHRSHQAPQPRAAARRLGLKVAVVVVEARRNHPAVARHPPEGPPRQPMNPLVEKQLRPLESGNIHCSVARVALHRQ